MSKKLLRNRQEMLRYQSFVFIFLNICFFGCSNQSVYLGGVGGFYDYEDLENYRSRGMSTPNSKNQLFNDDSFKAFENNFNASNAPIDSFSGKTASLTFGMRESEAIQRATMKPYQIAGKWYYPTKVKMGQTFDGIASWYGPNFHSKLTSNGETYNMHAHTAASKTLPMNTVVRVINKENNKMTIVRINDRGPFVDGRIIDLSNVAAKDIDMVGKGTAKVRVQIIGFGGKIDKKYQNSLQVSSKVMQDEFDVDETQSIIEEGVLSLQIGAFQLKSGAEFMKETYDKKISKYNIGIKESKGLYIVLINGFKSEDEVQDFAKANNFKPVIVRE